ncbi:MAG: hypothetical protein ACRC1S_07475 [Vibrio sp.]
MVEANSYQMAIDLLCCHLGIDEQQARIQLGLAPNPQNLQQRIIDTQQSLLGFDSKSSTN